MQEGRIELAASPPFLRIFILFFEQECKAEAAFFLFRRGCAKNPVRNLAALVGSTQLKTKNMFFLSSFAEFLEFCMPELGVEFRSRFECAQSASLFRRGSLARAVTIWCDLHGNC